MIRVRRFFEHPDQLRMHLRMTHGHYVEDVKAIRKSKEGPAVTLKTQLSEIHQTLHADIEKGDPSHGLVPHTHVL